MPSAYILTLKKLPPFSGGIMVPETIRFLVRQYGTTRFGYVEVGPAVERDFLLSAAEVV